MFKGECRGSEIAKSANRISFNGDEEEIHIQDETIGLNSLGKNSSILLQMKIPYHQKKLTKVKENKFQRPSFTKGVTGSSSSLSFTPIQGIELSNPLPSLPFDTTDGSKSYFSGL
jgi:U4/U6 small nuclear ribonucleoprotein PRP31